MAETLHVDCDVKQQITKPKLSITDEFFNGCRMHQLSKGYGFSFVSVIRFFTIVF